jgi:hypothetical protein
MGAPENRNPSWVDEGLAAGSEEPKRPLVSVGLIDDAYVFDGFGMESGAAFSFVGTF